MMKKMLIGLLVLGLSFGGNALASNCMDHGDGNEGKKMQHDKAMDHGAMEHGGGNEGKKMQHDKAMDHGAMSMGDGMIMLQGHEVDGIMSSVHLMDTREKMAKLGMTMTHHIMVGFTDTEGEPVAEGKAAVKVESPDGEIKTVKMMAMKGQFGADIQMDQKGMYHFKVGTKLADGTKRTFHFHHEN